jgi:hypothetical protein
MQYRLPQLLGCSPKTMSVICVGVRPNSIREHKGFGICELQFERAHRILRLNAELRAHRETFESGECSVCERDACRSGCHSSAATYNLLDRRI